MDRKTEMQDPDKGQWSYRYNSFGELIEQTDAKGQRVVLAYDDLGRKTTRHDYNETDALEGYTRWQYDTAPRGLGKLDYVSYHKGSSTAPASYQKLLSYDNIGRLHETVTSIGLNGADGDHYELVTYDEFGRIFQQFDAARASNNYENNGIEFRYNDYGYQYRIVDAVYDGADTRRVYQSVQRHDVRGNVIEEQLGNGITRLAQHDSSNGRLNRLSAETSAGNSLLTLDLTWDAIGNLKSRNEKGTLNGSYSRDVNEIYNYDALNRLTGVSGDRRITAGDGSSQENGINLYLSYSLNGNITWKSDVGHYQYNSKPHAVTQAGNNSYSYDANGNNISGAGRVISYSTFDKPTRIESGGNVVQFAYGPQRQRYKRTDTATSGAAAGITETLYLGSVEKILRPNGERQWKRYIGGSLLITQTLAPDNSIANSTEDYLLKDHLGSVNLITDQNGSVKQWFQYDAFGQRLLAFDVENLGLIAAGFYDENRCNSASSNYDCNADDIAYTDSGHAQDRVTTRGYTGHETIASMGIIHMNGRIYDPRLGRFLQADPLVDGMWDTQGYNRYSYGKNNPLNGVDPSGYGFVDKLFKLSVTHHILNVLPPQVAQLAQIAATAVAGFFCGPCSIGVAAAFSTQYTYAQTGDVGSALKSGAIAGVTAAAFYAVGQFGNTLGDGFGAGVARVMLHGAVGGVMVELQGGKFGHGFAAAGLGKAITLGAAGITDSLEMQFVAAVVAGGTASEVTGGKFMNGAATAAFGFLFNQAMTVQKRTITESDDDIYLAAGDSKSGFQISQEGAVQIYEKVGLNNIPDALSVDAAGIFLADDMLAAAVPAQDLISILEPSPFGKLKTLITGTKIITNGLKTEAKSYWRNTIDDVSLGMGARAGVKYNHELMDRYRELPR